jgi:hypothetical protein
MATRQHAWRTASEQAARARAREGAREGGVSVCSAMWLESIASKSNLGLRALRVTSSGVTSSGYNATVTCSIASNLVRPSLHLSRAIPDLHAPPRATRVRRAGGVRAVRGVARGCDGGPPPPARTPLAGPPRPRLPGPGRPGTRRRGGAGAGREPGPRAAPGCGAAPRAGPAWERGEGGSAQSIQMVCRYVKWFAVMFNTLRGNSARSLRRPEAYRNGPRPGPPSPNPTMPPAHGPGLLEGTWVEGTPGRCAWHGGSCLSEPS